MLQRQYQWLSGEMKNYIGLVAVTNGIEGYIVFAKLNNFTITMFDNHHEIKAVFYPDSFTINDVSYNYNTLIDYKNIPDVLQYLKQQNL